MADVDSDFETLSKEKFDLGISMMRGYYDTLELRSTATSVVFSRRWAG